MDFKNILEYQRKDSELIKIERELNSNPSKKISNDMIAVVKAAQEKSAQLEKKAEIMLKDFENLKKSYESNMAQVQKFISKNIESVSAKDLENIVSASNTIINNFNVL